MIIGIGTDIVEITRITELKNKFGDKFYNRIYSKNEILRAENFSEDKKINYYAKRFAAKESFAKALGTGIGEKISFKEIEIINDKNGKPTISLSNERKKELEKYLGCDFNIFLSLSDEKNVAMAFVVIESC